MKEISTREAREDLSDTLNQVAFGGQRVVLSRRGRRIAAVVPLADLEQLERQGQVPLATETAEVTRLREAEEAADAELAAAQSLTAEKRAARAEIEARIAGVQREIEAVGEQIEASDPDQVDRDLAVVAEQIRAADAHDAAAIEELHNRRAELEAQTLATLVEKRAVLEAKIESLQPRLRDAQAAEGAAMIAEEAPERKALETRLKRQVTEIRVFDAAIVDDARAFGTRYSEHWERLQGMLLEASHLEADVSEARTGHRHESSIGLRHFNTAVGQVSRALPSLEAAQKAMELADSLAAARARGPEPYYDPRQQGALPGRGAPPAPASDQSDAGDEDGE